MAVDAGTARGYLDLDIDGFSSALKSAYKQAETTGNNIATSMGRKMQSVGSSIQSLGSTLTLGITAPLTAIGGLSLTAFSTFETSLAKVKTIADGTVVPIEQMGEEIRDLAVDFGASASDISESVYQAISAGVDTADAVSFVAQANKLAIGGFTDSTTAVDTLTTVMNAYGLSAEEATHISDVLISTQNKGKTSVAELGATMGKVIPVASSMNVSVENLGVAYAELTAKGINTAESTTMLKAMFSELGDSGSDTAAILKDKTGKSFQDLMAEGHSLRDVLGIVADSATETGTNFGELWSSSEAGSAAMVLMQGSAEDFNATLLDFQTTTGDTDTAFETMSNTLSFKLKEAFAAVRDVAITLGESLARVLGPIIEKITGLVQKFGDWLNSLSEEQLDSVVKFGLMIAVAGPLLKIIGMVTSGIGGLVTGIGNIPGMITSANGMFDKMKLKITNVKEASALASAGFTGMAGQTSMLGATLGTIGAGPIMLIIGAILGIVAAIATLWKNNEEFRTNVSATWEKIKTTWTEFISEIKESFQPLIDALSVFVEWFKGIWNEFCNFLAPIFEGIWNNIATSFQFILDTILGIVDIFVGIFTGDWSQVWEGVKGIFLGAWEYIVGIFQNVMGVITGILDVVCGWFGTTWDETWTGIKTFFIDIWTNLITWFTTTGENIKNWWNDLWTGISTWFSETWNGIVEFFSKSPEEIGRILGEMVGKAIQWAIDMKDKAVEMAQGFIENITTWFTELPGKIKTWFDDTWNKAKTWGSDMKTKATETAQGFIDNIVTWFKELPGKIQTWFTDTWNKAKQFGSDLWEKAKEIGKTFVSDLLGGIKELPGKMLQAGKDAVQGIWDGVQSMWSSFTSWWDGLFGGFVDGIKGIFGGGKSIQGPVSDGLSRGLLYGAKESVATAFTGIQSRITSGISSLGFRSKPRNFFKGINSLSSAFKDSFDGLGEYVEGIESRVLRSVKNMTRSINDIIDTGQGLTVMTDGVGYVSRSGFDQGGKTDGSGKPKIEVQPQSGGDTYIFNSPKPIDELEASRQLKRTKRDLAEGF